MATIESKILCCLCGTSITPNEVAMCIECIQTQVDITEDFKKVDEIIQCKKCDRWQVTRDHWQHHELESSSFLAVCLKRIHGIDKVKVLHAKWVWTEPHSKRIKLSALIERAVLNGKALIEQTLIVEFIVVNKQCLDCIREATDHTWGALVQIRQRNTNKSTLFTLETIILKSGLQNNIINLSVLKDGLDLYFRTKSHSDKMIELITSSMPTKFKISKKLISKDTHTSVAKYEHTIIMEVAPLSKGDLILTNRDSSIGGRTSYTHILMYTCA